MSDSKPTTPASMAEQIRDACVKKLLRALTAQLEGKELFHIGEGGPRRVESERLAWNLLSTLQSAEHAPVMAALTGVSIHPDVIKLLYKRDPPVDLLPPLQGLYAAVSNSAAGNWPILAEPLNHSREAIRDEECRRHG